MAYFPIATQIAATYTLTGPDGSIAVFNDPTSANFVGYLTDVTGLDSADIRESASDLIEADGGAHGSFYFGRRPVVLNGKVFGHATPGERAQRLDRARRASLALRGDSILKWIPAGPLASANEPLGRTNYATNPRVAVDTSNWAYAGTAGGGISRVTAPSQTTLPAGVAQALRFAQNDADLSSRAQLPIPAVNGEYIVASAYVRRQSGSQDVKIRVVEGIASQPTNAADSPNHGTTVGGSWTRLITAPLLVANDATQHYFRLQEASFGAGTAGNVDVTAVVVRKFPDLASANAYLAAGPGPYFDGGLTGGIWLGVANNSSSQDFVEVFVPVRRQQPFRETGGWAKDFQIPLVSARAVILSTTEYVVAGGVVQENNGNYPSYPIFAITGAVTNPRVDTTPAPGTFRTTGLTLAAGETVEYDMLTHTGVFTAGARVGQTANQYINFATTVWPTLEGNGTTDSFALTGAGTLSVRYRNAWA